MKKKLLSVLLCFAAIFAIHAQISIEDVEIGVPIERTLQAGDEHWFRISAYRDGIFSLYLYPKTKGIYEKIYAELYDSDEKPLFVSDEGQNENRFYEINWITETGKTYLVKVRGEDKNITGAYKLTIYHYDVENIDVGKPRIKNLGDGNSVHYFSFTITEAGYYEFGCAAEDATGVFILLENEKLEFIADIDSDDYRYRRSMSLDSGIYYFYVIAKGGDFSDNTDYIISVEKLE